MLRHSFGGTIKTHHLQRVARKAALIFTGTVVSIAPVRGNGEETNSVEVTFQIEQALRGLRAGQRYTIREWSGLWMSGHVTGWASG